MKQRLIIFWDLFSRFFTIFFLLSTRVLIIVNYLLRARDTVMNFSVELWSVINVFHFIFRFRQGNLSQCICRDGIRWDPIWLRWVRRRPGQRWSLRVTKIRSTLRAWELLRCRKWILVYGFGWRRREWILWPAIIGKLSQCKSSITYDTATDIITRALRHVTAHGSAAHEHHTTATTADELVSRWKHKRTGYNLRRSRTHESSPLQSDTSAPRTITQLAKWHFGRKSTANGEWSLAQKFPNRNY